MKGSKIIVSGDPRGVWLEGTIFGTPKPGICVTIRATALVGDEPVFEPYNVASDGKASVVGILLEDSGQGRTYNDAYVTGTKCQVYFPLMGEQFNIWFQNQSGTADDVAIGDLFMLDDGTGQLLANSSGDMVPFVAMETLTDPTADKLIRVMYTGH